MRPAIRPERFDPDQHGFRDVTPRQLTIVDHLLRTGETRLPPSHELLDARTLLAACGSDATILSRICQAVGEQLPKDLTALEHAFRDRDAPLLRDEARRLHGIVAAFSSVAGAIASDLEDRADQGELDEAGRLLNQLKGIAPELLREISGVTLDVLLTASVGVRPSTAPPAAP
jgi:two-component system, sensor histidine kinase and response regulator